MGILANPETQSKPTTKRRASSITFSNLNPLKTQGTKNFAGYRDSSAQKGSPPFGKDGKGSKRKDADMDSDADDEEDPKDVDDDETNGKDEGKSMLSPEDAEKQGELAEGVRKIKVRHLPVDLLLFSLTW